MVFVVCGAVDAFLGRWTLLPIFVTGFYAGMILLALLVFPMLSRWRAWLRRRGTRTWYLVQAGFWTGSMVGIIFLAPWWLGWSWSGLLPLQVIGGIVLGVSVVIGGWAAGRMGWDRLSVTATLFPSGAGTEEINVPQRLVVEGPYRFVRNPLTDADVGVIVGTALLAHNWVPSTLAVVYLAQVALQLPLEERELGERFSESYRRYHSLVPRFVPRLRPVEKSEIY